MDLLNVDRALERILVTIAPLSNEFVPLEECLGRVSAVNVSAQVPLPSFPNSSMDGFAIHASDVQNAQPDTPVHLPVVADIPAGTTTQYTLKRQQAARIMTGAPMPHGADAVVPVEDTDAKWLPGSPLAPASQVSIYRRVKAGDYVRHIGEDVRPNDLIVRQGARLSAAEIGLLAAVGQATVEVIRKPRVAIISTGDELIEVDEVPTFGQIRNSNIYTLSALVTASGGIPIRIPTARDSLEDVRLRFHEALAQQPDLIISSAGVSVGAFDVVRTIIDELGHVDFWKINLRPGKPLAFGHVKGIPFFGLPGNPVSAMVTFDVFVRPTLIQMGMLRDDAVYLDAITAEDITSDGRRTYMRVKLSATDEGWIARTTGTQSSGVLSSMMLADGLLIIPEDTKFLPAGSCLRVRLLKSVQEIN